MAVSHRRNGQAGLMKFHKGQGHSSLYVETAKHNSSSMPVQEYVQPKMLIEWAGVTGIGHGSNSQERVKREKINGEAYFSLASPHLGKIKMTNQQKNVHGFQESGTEVDKIFFFWHFLCIWPEIQNLLDGALSYHMPSDVVK